MKPIRLKLSAVFMLYLLTTGLQAQEAIPASGGNASGSGGLVSYSVGQVVYTSNTGTNGSVVQGVQVPFEISEVTGLEEAKGITLKCLAYPNPTKDFLILEVDSSTFLTIHSLSYQLFDICGMLIETKKVEGTQTNIVMSYHAPANYFLKVVQCNKVVKIFKIIKK